MATWRTEALEPVDYNRDIRPLLSSKCFECHGPDAQSRKASLRLDDRVNATAFRDGRQAIAPGSLLNSELVARITSTNPDEIMPPPKSGARLTPDQVALLQRWIEAGAPFLEHWSFSPIRRPAVPSVQTPEWCQNPIDRFVLSQLETLGLRGADLADRRTLARRASLDLLGLPPEWGAVEAFVADTRRDAWRRWTEQLLQSPHYGERWGRHWLDVARYADSGGFETDIFFGHAWRFRDYVVRSLNADKAFDRFIREQIAGDELAPHDPDSLIATGFFTTGPVLQEAGMVPGKLEYDQLTDAVDTTGAAFLGLTLACARCHDHKYDPIPQREYFSLQAIFAASDQYDLDASGKRLRDRAALGNTQTEFELEQVRARIKRESDPQTRQALLLRLGDYYLSRQPKQPKRPGGSKEGLDRERVALALAHLEGPSVIPRRVLGHRDSPLETRVLKRGELEMPGEVVGAGVPEAIKGQRFPTQLAPTQLRLALADWVASESNPLTARVLVNRVWQWHFGQGLVRTPNDFGWRGDAPSHPELLDWLAVELMESGWSLKHLHRLILGSSTYQQSSLTTERSLELDPSNRWLSRYQPHRLEAEAIWDSVRSVSGSLHRDMGGLPFAPPLDDQEMIGNFLRWPTSTPEESNRRGIYLLIKRSFRFPTLSAFDLPDNISSCGLRDVTTVPNQALAMLNNRSMLEQARVFARRIIQETGWNAERWVNLAWRHAYGRPVLPQERQRALDFLATTADARRIAPSSSSETALVELCLALLNTNEFIYIP